MTEEVGEVLFFRLDNGEDVIAHAIRVLKDDFEDEHYILDSPLKVIYLQGNSKSLSISLMQWIFPKISLAKQCKIMASKILTTAEPSDNLVDFYYETIDQMEKYRIERERETEDYTSSKPSLEPVTEEDLYDNDFQDFTEEDGVEMMQELIEHLKNTKRTIH